MANRGEVTLERGGKQYGATYAVQTNGVHIAFGVPDTDTVDTFHREALRLGGRDAGAPDLRPEYSPDYYGAFVFDPDGNKIEAVVSSR